MRLPNPDFRDVLLFGYEDEENLGLRYIASYLVDNGLSVEIVPLQDSTKELLLEKIFLTNPTLIGFSMIYQGMVREFAEFVSFLREKGVKCHFTMGGHFPSIEYKKTLELIDGLDSIVRHEGEVTLLDLYRHVQNSDDWSQVHGLAFKRDGHIQITPPRQLIRNLDEIPFPLRSGHIRNHRGLGISSMISSRGCYFNCSFCSIQEFYSSASGPKRRSRSPENVIREMVALFKTGTRIFIFKDDDFGMNTASQQLWIKRFVKELEDSVLAKRILWRISCRIDEVDPEMIRLLKDAGLQFLYLGIESGNDQGLETFNKHYKVSEIFKTIDVIDEAGMNFDYGFMIFDPDSSITSVKDNISFLRELAKGGRVPVHFTKMVPYDGTPIARKLKKEGRLKGPIESRDYSYVDPKLDLLESFIKKAFYNMMFDRDGLLNKLQFVLFDAVVLDRFLDDYNSENYKLDIKNLVELCNDSILETMELAVSFMERRSPEEIIKEWPKLEKLAKQECLMQYAISQTLDRILYYGTLKVPDILNVNAPFDI